VSNGAPRRLALFCFSPGFRPHSGLKYIILCAGSPREKGRIPMIKMTVTNAAVSKGFGDNPAIRFSENAENPSQSSARFRVGMRVYDKHAENNHRYVNINVKVFGYLVERVKSMKLDAGTYVNITGRYDEETWDDQTTHEKKSAPVLIADEIEFCHSGSAGNGNGSGGNGNGYDSAPPAGNGQTQSPKDNFAGFEGFGGSNPYFPEG
jgi:single-stranded DNA-binding protein